MNTNIQKVESFTISTSVSEYYYEPVVGKSKLVNDFRWKKK